MSLCNYFETASRRSLQRVLTVNTRTNSNVECNRASTRFVSAWTRPRSCQSCCTTRRSNWVSPHKAQPGIFRFLHSHETQRNRAFIALGSNMGDRVAMIELACKEMESTGQVQILRTSSLYETKAMYVLDQDNFVNGACEIATSLEPIQLLDLLQSVENKLGRVKVIDKGPRNIDLDVLLYVRQSNATEEMVRWNDERLVLPHKLMFEREFVLRPLYEILPNQEDFLVEHNPQKEPFKTFVKRELDLLQSKSSDPLSPLTRLGHGLPDITPHRSDRSTRVMSILNMTPDSFSEDGMNYDLDQGYLKERILNGVKEGACIIDVGGQSTRPDSEQSSSKEELSRALPAIKFIQSLNLPGIAISSDTYRADVARAAVNAGAHIINDVSAGLLDDNMLSTAAELGCTICLMHMRGTPQTMNALTDYPDGVIETVGRELLQRVQAAEAAGIRRWRIILDPGIGFAKTQEQNLELLRRLKELRRYPGLENFPWLVGTSRKRFIGNITGVEKARDRVWGTAATVAAAVQGGADVVRVHDSKEMAQVVKMADAIWRI